MNKDLFEKAKQAVAEKHKYTNFSDLVILGEGLPTEYYEEAAELYSQWVANEAVKEKEVIIEKLSSRLSDLFRLLNKHLNNHPEIFSELDRMRIDAAQSTIEKHAKPFDPRQVLRQSDDSLPFPQQPDER